VGRLDGKVALITGAASGIGAASVRVFTAEGARVVAADIADAGPAAAAAGGAAVAVRCDVTRAEDCEAAVAEAVRRFGGLDILFANAGVELDKSVMDTTEAEWHRVLSVNLTGVFLCCRAAIPRMRARGGGAIVVTASANSFATEPAKAAYCASKGGLIMLVRSLAIDYGREGIRANAICPGWVETPMTTAFLASPEGRKWGNGLQPRGRVAAPEEVARVAAFLASEDAANVTGAALRVDGGLTAVLNGHRFD
jgi:meso-butanediol dehydrogenase/(S,S)-butanediol dehydrogenase/diacetyl reductase